MKKREEFAKKMLREKEMIPKLIFSDEKLFNGCPQNEFIQVRRKKNDAFKDTNLNKSKKSNVSCMIWLYIHEGGKGDIFLAENINHYDERGNKISKKSDENESEKDNKGFDNKSYVQLIDKHAIPSINRNSLDWVFVQDNSRVHTSKKNNETIYDIFRKNNVEYIEWPVNSPDLHPVENAHKLLQDQVILELNKRIRKPKNKQQLFEIIEMCWYNNVNNQQIIDIHKSFEDRMKLCLIHKGNNNFPTSTKMKVNREKLSNFDWSLTD